MANRKRGKTNILKRVGGEIQGTETPRKRKETIINYNDFDKAYNRFMAKRGLKYSLY